MLLTTLSLWSVSQIMATIDDTLRECPPELSADLIDQGMFLAGGGSMLAGMDTLIADRTKLPVHVVTADTEMPEK